MKILRYISILLLSLSACEVTIIEPITLQNDKDSILLNVQPMKNDYACTITALGMWLQYWNDNDVHLNAS